VIDDQVVHLQSLVVGVGLGVPQKLQQEFRALLGPSALREFELFRLGATTDTSIESSEGNTFLVGNNIFQILNSPPQRHFPNCFRRLSRVLEMNAEI